jgi:hypothetical protein
MAYAVDVNAFCITTRPGGLQEYEERLFRIFSAARAKKNCCIQTAETAKLPLELSVRISPRERLKVRQVPSNLNRTARESIGIDPRHETFPACSTTPGLGFHRLQASRGRSCYCEILTPTH